MPHCSTCHSSPYNCIPGVRTFDPWMTFASPSDGALQASLGLKSAQDEQNEKNQENDPQPSARVVAPASAIWPRWNGTNEGKYEYNCQN